MVWLVKMLKEQMKDTQTAAICQQPQDMQGKSLATMTDQDFHCRKFDTIYSFIFETKPLTCYGPYFFIY
jgi:hypothetical protein